MTRSIFSAALTMTTALVAVAALPAPGFAQSSATAYAVEEILVTARKREESLQDAPIAITAFSEAGIEARGITNISEIGNFTPNLTFRSTAAIAASPSVASIYIRGIGQQDWALATDPGVGLYLDGVYIARSVGAVLDMLEVERVEVLKGPQGTLFGRNTIGGAVSITTKRPQFDEMYGSGEIVVGRYNRSDFRAMFNLPVSDTLAFNFSGSRKQRDGYVKNLVLGGPDLGDEDSWAGRASMRWMATENFEVYFAVDGSRERTNPAANVLIAVNENAIFPLLANGLELDPNNPVNRFGQNPSPVCLDQTDPSRLSDPTCFNSQWIAGPFRTFSTHQSDNSFVNSLIPGGFGVSPDTGLNTTGVSLDLNWDINESVSLRSITAYRDVSGFWSRDSDHSPLTVLQTANFFTQDQFSQELQAQGTALNGSLQWLIGGYYFQEDGQHFDVIELAGSVFDSGGLIDTDNKAVFGQFTYDIMENVHFTLGGRYTDEKKRFTPKSKVAQDNGLGIPAGVLVLPDEEASIGTEDFTPYVNLAFDVTEDAMVYASFSQGFKSGTFTQRVFPPRPDIPSADPEQVDAYELGFKTSWYNNRVRFNGAAFWTDYKDLQVNVTEAVPGGVEIGIITRNAAKARIRGLELELTALPLDNLVIEGGLGYLDAEYTQLDPGAVAAGLTLDSLLVNTPEWSITGALAYTINIEGGWELTPRADYSFTSKIANNSNNSPELIQGSVHLVNLALRLTDPDDLWAITGMVKNLTNKAYLVAGNDDPGSGIIEGVFARPREWSFGVKRKF